MGKDTVFNSLRQSGKSEPNSHGVLVNVFQGGHTILNVGDLVHPFEFVAFEDVPNFKTAIHTFHFFVVVALSS